MEKGIEFKKILTLFLSEISPDYQIILWKLFSCGKITEHEMTWSNMQKFVWLFRAHILEARKNTNFVVICTWNIPNSTQKLPSSESLSFLIAMRQSSDHKLAFCRSHKVLAMLIGEGIRLSL